MERGKPKTKKIDKMELGDRIILTATEVSNGEGTLVREVAGVAEAESEGDITGGGPEPYEC